MQKILDNHKKELVERNHILNALKLEYPRYKFSDTKITNPDEIVSLMNQNYGVGVQTQMIEELSKFGNETHAHELFSGVDNVIRKIADEAKLESSSMSIYAQSNNLAERLKTVSKIGNETQKAELIEKLRLSLNSNQNKKFAKEIYSAIGKVGKENPNNSKYSEILLDQLFSKNAKSVYPELANFNGQFHIITKGMIENPDNTKILAAAYKSAKTPAQKQILTKTILNDTVLTDTAIRSSSEFYEIDTNKRFLSDVLAEIRKSKQDGLSSWQNSHLTKLLGE